MALFPLLIREERERERDVKIGGRRVDGGRPLGSKNTIFQREYTREASTFLFLRENPLRQQRGRRAGSPADSHWPGYHTTSGQEWGT